MNAALLVSIPPGFDPEGLRVYAPIGRPLGIVVGRGMYTKTYTTFDLYTGELNRCVMDDRGWLSLADARTRDALARWVAEQVGLPVGPTAPGWVFEFPGFTLFYRPAISAHFVDDTRGTCGDRVHAVPALRPLQLWPHQDDARLPDGSRRVDALALAAVVRHLASLAP